MANKTRQSAAFATDLALPDAAGSDPAADPLLVDCAGCAVREVACADCVVTVLLGSAPPDSQPFPGDGAPARALAAVERAAIHALAEAGLVPRLRHLPVSPRPLAGHTIGWERLPHPDAGG
jgi:hypothetical protein